MNALESRTMRKVTWRLVPFLMACYFIAYLDRVNVAFAGPSMMKDLGLTAAAFGGAAGIFFIAYFFFEVPSNLAMKSPAPRPLSPARSVSMSSACCWALPRPASFQASSST